MEKIEIQKIIKSLERREKGEGVEVEHLLKVIHKGDSSLIQPLQELSHKYKWKKNNTELEVPLGSWIDIICDFFRGDISKMIEIAKQKDRYSEFAISILEELKNQISAEALIKIFQCIDLDNENDYKFAAKIVNAFNLVVSFGKDIRLNDEIKSQAKSFLLSTLLRADKNGDNGLKAICIYSYRGIGDENIITYLKSRSPMSYPFNGIEKQVINEIKKREK